MKKLTPRFSRGAANAVKKIVQRTADRQLSGLSPAERAEILNNILVARNPGGSSLKVHIAGKAAVTTEFGTRAITVRPWMTKLQRRLASPLRAALSGLLTPKR